MDITNVNSNVKLNQISGLQPVDTMIKPALVAYNNVNFRDFFKNEVSNNHSKSNISPSQNAKNQISEDKQALIDNNEYSNFVEKTKSNNRGVSASSYTSKKRFLKDFHPVPVGNNNSLSTDVSKMAIDKNEKIDKFGKDNPVIKQLTKQLDIKPPVNAKQESEFAQQVQEYKEDQLLSNPGGDNFFLNRKGNVIDNNFDHSKFSNRVLKDLDDSLGNFKNLAKDLGFGSEIKYIDKYGDVKTQKKVGFLGVIGNFFKDIASGLSFGAYTPNNEKAPVGIAGKVKHFFKKVFVQAMGKDFFVGVPQSIINVGEDALFASLNLVETIPDATIGNTKTGRKITTKVFDDVQVALDFVTDIMPGGEASTRMRTALVKKFKGNKNNSENLDEFGNPQAQYVRNSPFRKVIETLSFFMPFRI